MFLSPRLRLFCWSSVHAGRARPIRQDQGLVGQGAVEPRRQRGVRRRGGQRAQQTHLRGLGAPRPHVNGVVALHGAETAGGERDSVGRGVRNAPLCSSVCSGVRDGDTCDAATAAGILAMLLLLLLLPMDLLGVRAHVAD